MLSSISPVVACGNVDHEEMKYQNGGYLVKRNGSFG
jgi:hypothetical protein